MTNIFKTQSELEIQPLTGSIGAVIKGIKLSSQLRQEDVQSIEAALLKYKVIFFRDQTHLDDAEHEAFAKQFGTPVSHPTVPVKESTNNLYELNSKEGGKANAWHTDVTFADAYPKASILRAVTLPKVGGDTIWANTAEAYQQLPDELKVLAEKLWALHTNDYDYAAHHINASENDLALHKEVFVSTLFETKHPVVRVHPVTQEKTLVLGNFVKRILGYSSSGSQHLFSLLQEYITANENIIRWKWQEGDVAFWDNRATQHYAVSDYGEEKRIVRRVTLEGDVPISTDGKRSISNITTK